MKKRNFLQNLSPTIRKLASVASVSITIFPAIPLGKPQHRALENFLAKKEVSKYAIQDLKCRLGTTPNAENNIKTPQVDFETNTDATEPG